MFFVVPDATAMRVAASRTALPRRLATRRSVTVPRQPGGGAPGQPTLMRSTRRRFANRPCTGGNVTAARGHAPGGRAASAGAASGARSTQPSSLRHATVSAVASRPSIRVTGAPSGRGAPPASGNAVGCTPRPPTARAPIASSPAIRAVSEVIPGAIRRGAGVATGATTCSR